MNFLRRPIPLLIELAEQIGQGVRTRFRDDGAIYLRPLTDVLDSLLETHDRELAHAKSWSPDTAHTINTALTALQADACRLRENQNGDVATRMEASIEEIRQTVANAVTRTQTPKGRAIAHANSALGTAVDQIVRTIDLSLIDREIVWIISAQSRTNVAVNHDDLLDLLGTLVSHAAKHAQSSISITALHIGPDIELTVAADSLEATEPEHHAAFFRSVNAPLKAELVGRPAVLDIVDAYGGSIFSTPEDSDRIAFRVLLPAA